MAATAARAAPHPATPIAPTRAVPPASVAILRISYTPSKTAGSNTLTPNLRARVVGLGTRRVPDGQPFGLGPAGVAVAAQHASIYACPGGGRPTGRADPRLPHRTVPAYPPFGCVRLHDYADRRVMPTSRGQCCRSQQVDRSARSRHPECRDLAMPTAMRICVQSVECQIDCENRQIR